jgi:lipopolysaccharide biosynthesis glycosyltransferase
LIPSLKPELKKALYLDCDIVIDHDISELWNINISKFFAAGVVDCHINTIKHKLNLGFSKNTPYINGGVLLLNLKKLRTYNIQNKLFSNTHKIKNLIKYDDQDVINYTLKNKIKIIAPKYNLLVWFKDVLNLKWPCYYKDINILKSFDKPIIIHFCGGTKPWNAKHDNLHLQHPLWLNYYKYLIYTPYKFESFLFFIKNPYILFNKILNHIKLK